MSEKELKRRISDLEQYVSDLTIVLGEVSNVVEATIECVLENHSIIAKSAVIDDNQTSAILNLRHVLVGLSNRLGMPITVKVDDD